jgi:hypothetical protein
MSNTHRGRQVGAVRISPEAHRQAKTAAAAAGMTLQAWIERWLKAGASLEQHDRERRRITSDALREGGGIAALNRAASKRSRA